MNTPNLLLSSNELAHTGRSGYPILNEYLRNSVVVHRRRAVCRNLLGRGVQVALRLFSVSQWYSLSSATLEYSGWRQLNRTSLIHLLWGDRDWGFLDLLLNPSKNALLATFHACPDDFAATVSRSGRLKNLAAVILMSEVQRENFLKAGMRPDRIHVIQHGIDPKHFVPAKKKREPSTKFTALHVGSYRRNFDDLEAVCDKLSNSPNIRIKIITSPKIGARFANKPNVEVVSGLSDAELLKAYQDADCLLMTAEAATANNAILEGIACGLPVVTQRVGGIPEYVNTDCAFLCEPGDSDALVNGLERLQADLDLRMRMGQAARARALELDWVHVAAKTQAVYDQVLAERHR